jgi:hypothetical protein
MSSTLQGNLGPAVFGLENQTALGSGQKDAYQLTTQETVFTSVPVGSGARLPGATMAALTVFNYGANTLNLYPASGDVFFGMAVNAPLSVAPNAVLTVECFETSLNASPRTWYQFSSANTSSGVTQIVAGAGLAGGTITSTGTVSLATIAASSLMGNAAGSSAVPGAVAIGSGLSLSAGGTLTATGAIGTIVTANGLTANGTLGGTLTANGTIGLETLAASSLFGNAATVAGTMGAIAIGSGLSLSAAGTLSSTGGSATTVVAGANLTGGTITISGTIALQASPTITSTSNTNPAIVTSNSAVPATTLGGTVLQVIGVANGNTRLLLDAAGGTPNITLRRSDGSIGSPSAVQSGEQVGVLYVSGYGATGFGSAHGFIQAVAAENWSDTAQGFYVSFSDVTAGGISAAEIARIMNGVFLVGTTAASGSDKLQVVGGVQTDNLGVSGTLSGFPIGTGLSLSSGSLVATGGGGGIGTIVTANGLTANGTAGGTLTANGTIGLETIAATSLFGNAATTAGTMAAVAIGSGLTLSSAGTLSSTSSSYTAALGVVINSGTIEIENSVTLAGTAAGTLTISPGSGTKVSVVNMPSAGGTVTLAYAGTYNFQSSRIQIKQGATAGSIVLNSGTTNGFVFFNNGGPTSFTVTPSASVTDELAIEGVTTAYARVMAIAQGATA